MDSDIVLTPFQSLLTLQPSCRQKERTATGQRWRHPVVPRRRPAWRPKRLEPQPADQEGSAPALSSHSGQCGIAPSGEAAPATVWRSRSVHVCWRAASEGPHPPFHDAHPCRFDRSGCGQPGAFFLLEHAARAPEEAQCRGLSARIACEMVISASSAAAAPRCERSSKAAEHWGRASQLARSGAQRNPVLNYAACALRGGEARGEKGGHLGGALGV